MNILPGCFTRGLQKTERSRRHLFLFLGLLLLAAASFSLCCGIQGYRMEVFHVLLSRDTGSAAYRILTSVRIPRTLAAAAAGASLAVSGELLQTVLNNGMASPNVIGVNSGAGFAMLLSAVFFPWQPGAQAMAAFIGAEAAALTVYLLSVRAGASRTTIILAGLAAGGILTAGMNAIKALDPDLAAGSAAFYAGSFAGVTMKALQSALPYAAAGLVLALLLSRGLDILSLGEESAAGLGLNVGLTRFLAILAAALLAGSAVSYAGMLSFAGLLVPHMVRRLLGTDHLRSLPAEVLLGASFTILADTLARTLFAPYELPAGVILSSVGGIFFLVLLLRQKKRRLYD